MSDDVVIRVEGLWKRYGLPLPGFVRRGRHWLRSLHNSRNPQSAIRNPQSDDGPWALRDISFEVRRGETLGIIGRNGAGKSTLLKVLAGVTPATRGRVEVRGRVFPMIELNAGLHPELTGGENVRLLGVIMGLSRREIEAKMPEIEEFCELGEWFDKPVRMYSSGMLARLGFGVAMNVEAAIVLVDEVLAVGDTAFQRKCYDRLAYLEESGVTVLLVSHNIRQVERMATSVVWLDWGETVMAGQPSEVAQAYYQRVDEETLERAQQELRLRVGRREADAGGEMRILGARVLDELGRETDTVKMFGPMTIVLDFVALEHVESPSFTLGIHTTDLVYVSSFSTVELRDRPRFVEPGTHSIRCFIPRVTLTPGVYGIRAGIGSWQQYRRVDKAYGLAIFQVVSDDFKVIEHGTGLVHTEVQWIFPDGVEKVSGDLEH